MKFNVMWTQWHWVSHLTHRIASYRIRFFISSINLEEDDTINVYTYTSTQTRRDRHIHTYAHVLYLHTNVCMHVSLRSFTCLYTTKSTINNNNNISMVLSTLSYSVLFACYTLRYRDTHKFCRSKKKRKKNNTHTYTHTEITLWMRVYA